MDPVTFYKCLADDTRLHCMLLLERAGELCVCELMAATGESQPKVSRHLAQLRECRFTAGQRRGKWVYYRLSPGLPAWSKAVLAATSAGNQAYLSEALGRLGRPEEPGVLRLARLGLFTEFGCVLLYMVFRI